MVQLPDDLENGRNIGAAKSLKSQLFQLINAPRIHNIPFLNLGIVAVLGVFLAKLTTKYKDLYMKNSLVTIIVTNLVLYGISETLAQSILSFNRQSPMISFSFNNPSFEPVRLSAVNPVALNVGASYSPAGEVEGTTESDHDEVESDDSDIDEENLDSYLRLLRSDTSLPFQDSTAAENPQQTTELSYFKFNRLAGFMCWGFVMAFVQCWWYRFLQIYSKHPQFVEVLRKVMSDQFCFSPVSLFCFFTYGTMVLESGTWADARAKLQKLYLPTLVINYCVWFPVQFINFLLVPRDFQVPFSSSISVLWNCFLSMRNSSS